VRGSCVVVVIFLG